MYCIALCDDERREIVKSKEMLQNYKKSHPEINFEIGIFENAERLLLNVKEGYAPDLILMDIYMEDKTGIEAARDLRRMGNRSRVIFLTSSEKHAVEAFSVEAAQYLVKPVSESELFPMLDRQIEILDGEKQKYVAIETDNRLIRVMVHDIIYCEAQGKYQNVHLTDGTQVAAHMTMSGLEKLFLPYEEIVRIGKAYIVNLEHMEGLDGQAVQMDNGQRLFLPRGSYQPLKKQYVAYYMRVLS